MAHIWERVATGPDGAPAVSASAPMKTPKSADEKKAGMLAGRGGSPRPKIAALVSDFERLVEQDRVKAEELRRASVGYRGSTTAVGMSEVVAVASSDTTASESSPLASPRRVMRSASDVVIKRKVVLTDATNEKQNGPPSTGTGGVSDVSLLRIEVARLRKMLQASMIIMGDITKRLDKM